jgi:hypothetical protein
MEKRSNLPATKKKRFDDMDYRSKYNYAAKFVNLVRESTPKITVYTDDAVYRSAQLTFRLSGLLGILAVSYETYGREPGPSFQLKCLCVCSALLFLSSKTA